MGMPSALIIAATLHAVLAEQGQPCVENATVGNCLGVGCFADHGSATCHSTNCICDPGSCSSDHWHCVPVTTSTITETTTVTTTTPEPTTTVAATEAPWWCDPEAAVGFCIFGCWGHENAHCVRGGCHCNKGFCSPDESNCVSDNSTLLKDLAVETRGAKSTWVGAEYALVAFAACFGITLLATKA